MNKSAYFKLIELISSINVWDYMCKSYFRTPFEIKVPFLETKRNICNN